MTNPNEPQAQSPDPSQAAVTQSVKAQWLDIYESDSVKVSVLLRNESVTRLVVNTEKTLPLSFAANALKRWNTDPKRHFELDPDQWVKVYWTGTQPRYDTTVETTFKDIEWTVIDTEPGITVSVVETAGKVTHVRLDWSSEADLELEETGTVCFVDNALHDWNQLPGRQFQLAEEAWTQSESGDNLRFETTVQTTFQTVLEVYIDTPEPLQHANLVHTVLALLSHKLPEYDVDFVSLFGSVRRAEQHPFVRVLRTYVDNGEYDLETESGCGVLPPYKVPLSLEVVEPVLQAFEQQLAAPEATQQDVLDLRRVYRAIAKEQGVDLETVNGKRGHHLPKAYLQGTPEPPETEYKTTEEVSETTTAATTGGGINVHDYLNLQTAVKGLVEGLKTFEAAPFSAAQEGVTQQSAEEMAAYLIHTLLWQPSGLPGTALNGQVVQAAIDSVVSYYEHEHDALVAEQEEADAALGHEP